MIGRMLSVAALAGLLMGALTPVSYAADTPKTKTECEKHKDMKWDASTMKCVKK